MLGQFGVISGDKSGDYLGSLAQPETKPIPSLDLALKKLMEVGKNDVLDYADIAIF
jgi:hypothetical protein